MRDRRARLHLVAVLGTVPPGASELLAMHNEHSRECIYGVRGRAPGRNAQMDTKIFLPHFLHSKNLTSLVLDAVCRAPKCAWRGECCPVPLPIPKLCRHGAEQMCPASL